LEIASRKALGKIGTQPKLHFPCNLEKITGAVVAKCNLRDDFEKERAFPKAL